MSGAELALAATAVMVTGQVVAGNAANQAGEMNASLARQQADATAQAGILEQRELFRQQGELEGRQVALYGVSGVRSDVGSPADVRLRSSQTAALDRMAAGYNNRVQRMQAESAARLERWQGRTARYTSRIGAAGTLLSGASAFQQMGGATPTLDRFGAWASSRIR